MQLRVSLHSGQAAAAASAFASASASASASTAVGDNGPEARFLIQHLMSLGPGHFPEMNLP